MSSSVEVPEPVPTKINDSTLRLVSFNINGLKTLAEYHPWNQLKTYNAMFDFLHADIVTFQEVKIQKDDINSKLVNIDNFKSFISIPRSKKGYSGVAVFVRRPPVYSPWLEVIKVEEGITGWLDVKGKQSSYRKLWSTEESASVAIGGYQEAIDKAEGLKIDNDGRCVIIEMAIGLVVISVYCPANSGLTDDGETHRCLFLRCLMERVANLRSQGKEVVVMGDINVAPGLLDKDEFIREALAEKLMVKCENDKDLQFINKDLAISYRTSTPARSILNKYLWDTSELTDNTNKTLFDLGREFHPTRTRMYTCWNTQKNYRPMNMGSRIDLFISTVNIKQSVNKCDILRYLYGSDHCPVYCDFDTASKDLLHLVKSAAAPKIKHFEAKFFYDLNQSKSIDSFFKTKRQFDDTQKKIEFGKKRPLDSQSSYTSRKKQAGQASLSSFFGMKNQKNAIEYESLFVNDSDEHEDEIETVVSRNKQALSASMFSTLLKASNGVPLCKHDELSVLRTVSKGTNMGKKFWCCSKPKGDLWDKKEDEVDKSLVSCGFFKWASK